MHGNQWVLKIAVLKYYSVSKRGTTAKSNPKQATDPISLHTKFGDNSSNTFPLNERKPCVTPDIGRRTSDGAKIIYPPPRGVDIIIMNTLMVVSLCMYVYQGPYSQLFILLFPVIHIIISSYSYYYSHYSYSKNILLLRIF